MIHFADRAPEVSTKRPPRRRPRILLIAYACNPREGSECIVGWQRAVQASRSFDTWVICDQRFEADIEAHLAMSGGIDGLHFAYLPRTRMEKWCFELPANLYWMAYHRWHRRAFGVAERLHREFGFDVVHQVNWTGFREPGYLWRLDAPFVWGPVGGTQNLPWRFLSQLSLPGAVKEGARSLMNLLQLRLSPQVRRAARRASVLLTGNSTGERDFRRVHGADPILLCEAGIDSVMAGARQGNGSPGPLRLLWSGVLDHHKALPLLLEAMAGLPPGACELRILGEGPLARDWRRRAERLGVGDRCSWLGWLPRHEALEQYAHADVLVFTSLRDTSGNVVLEALSRGVPVLCLDHQGVGDIVDDRSGIKVPVSTPRQTIADLTAALHRLAADRKLVAELSLGAAERAQKYLWTRNGDRMADIYRQLIPSAGQNGDAGGRHRDA